jgi:high-affinity nickel permease
VFGLDHALSGLSGGGTLLVVLAISFLLGLRHASDPDHLAAVATLSAGEQMPVQRAARLGFAWGAGHGTSLFALGLPVVLWRAFLPHAVQQTVEVVVGLTIVVLAVWLLARWRRGTLTRRAQIRSGSTAYGIGVLHGAGGSAAISLLLLAAIPERSVAFAALVVFAAGTCVSMAMLSAGFGRALGGHGAVRSAPYLGILSLLFGLWYVLVALGVAPSVY